MIYCFFWDAFWILSCQFWSTVLQWSNGPCSRWWSFYNWGCVWVWHLTLHIVDLWQYCVCCIRSGVIRCTLFMMLYLCRMWQFGLHTVLWSHIGILMGLLAAEFSSIAGPLFPLSVPVERSCWPWQTTADREERTHRTSSNQIKSAIIMTLMCETYEANSSDTQGVK